MSYVIPGLAFRRLAGPCARPLCPAPVPGPPLHVTAPLRAHDVGFQSRSSVLVFPQEGVLQAEDPPPAAQATVRPPRGHRGRLECEMSKGQGTAVPCVHT